MNNRKQLYKEIIEKNIDLEYEYQPGIKVATLYADIDMPFMIETLDDYNILVDDIALFATVLEQEAKRILEQQ